MIIYCATTNRGKIREFEGASGGEFRFAPLPGIECIPSCPETGETFEENAIQKALYYGNHTVDLLIAEDSGLSVDALAGAPGVYSARFAGAGATDEDNNRLLLERMFEVEDRRGRYICVIALARGREVVRTFRGEVEGELLRLPSGTGGFGYDPLFYYPPFGCTFAEISREQKQSVSHRGRAIQALLEYLRARTAPQSERKL